MTRLIFMEVMLTHGRVPVGIFNFITQAGGVKRLDFFS